MSVRPFVCAILIGAATSAASPTLAHHSNSKFEVLKIEAVTGTVTRWDWSNPHTWLYLTVKTADGATKDYALEGRPPGMLVRAGWSKTVMKPGDKVKAEYNPAKDGTPTGLLSRVTLADGKILPPGGVAASGGPVQ